MSQRTSRFQVQFDVAGDGEVRASLKTLREEVKATTQAVEDSGEEWYEFGHKIGTAMKFAGAAVLAGVGLIVRNTIGAEQELAQLGAVLRSTGQDATFSRDQLVEMADAIAAASTFSAGEIVKAETRLLSYSGIASKNFPAALQIAIDQAARLGMGVEQSAETIGRALESPQKAAAALAQQGFGAAFTDSVRKAIKELDEAGKTAEAQQIILDILTESYGGAAQAARDTFGGSLVELKNTLADLLTGDTGGEGLKGTHQAVEDLIVTLKSGEVRAGFANITEGALGSISALASFVGWVNQAFEATQRMVTIQGGGFSKLMGGENIAAQRSELAAVQRELAERRAADASMQQGRLTGDWLSQRAGIARGLPARAIGFQGIGGSTDNELRSREAALRAQIEFNERIFGDPSRRKVNFSDQGDLPASMLRPVDAPATRTPGGGDGKKPRAAQLTEAEKAAKQLNAEYGRMLERLQQEVALNNQTTELARVNYQIKQDGLDALNPKLAEELRMAAQQVDAQEKSNALRDEGARLIEDMRTPQEALNAQLARYQELLDAGAIDQTVYQRATKDAEDAYKAGEEAAKRAAQTFRTTEDVVADFSSRTQDYMGADLYDAFSGNADRIAERWKHLLLQLAAEWAAAKIMEMRSGNSSGQSGGGFWASVATAIGSLFGGNKATGGNYQAGKLYEVAENGKPELIQQNGRTFMVSGAGGNVVPAQYAAMGGGGSAGMRFAVSIENKGEPIQAESAQAEMQSDGSFLIRMITGTVKNAIARGELDSPLGQSFGLKRQGVARG